MKNKKLQKLLAGTLAVTMMASGAPGTDMFCAKAKGTENKERSSTSNQAIQVEENTSNVFKVTMDETGNLTASDNAADVTTPFSWDNASVYFALTDRFYNGDKSNDHSYGRSENEVDADQYENRTGTFHGGDLKGMTQKIEEGYFDDLGTNAIWITAPYEQIHGGLCGKGFKHYAYHGYYVLDYTSVDGNMGTEKDLETFIDTAHEHGIRVIFDIVMNHAGYADAVTINEYFGEGTSALSSDWKDIYYKTNPSEYKWYYDYNEVGQQNGKAGMLVAASGDWTTKWWGTSWIRAIPERFSGYEGKEAPDIETCVDGLPDFKTEGTSDPGIPPILKTKWTKEGCYDEKVALTNESLQAGGLDKNVTGYISAWLSNWVRKYGVDGFRCDTAKHVRTNAWGTLKKSCVQALKDWRKANPDKPGAKWTDDFWMTGEAWGHGVDKDDYYTTGGFDSMINFSYQGTEKNSGSSLDGVYANYAGKLNSDPSFNVLSFISSHDSGLGARSANAGIALLLNPGGVQTFYGDESGRQNVGGPDYEGARGNMNWDSMDKGILTVWQKVGRFRRNHISVGAGQHNKLSESPYTFSRTYSGKVQGEEYEDQVVVALPGKAGSYDISVKGVFDDGSAVTDEYSGEVYTVDGGKVSVTCDSDGVILLGNGGVAKASVGATVSQAFTTDTLEISLKATKTKEAYYILNDGEKTTFKTGEKITLGKGDSTGTTYKLVVGGTSEEGEKIAEKTFTYSKEEKPAFSFYIRTKASDYSSAPYIYLYGAANKEFAGKWPGTQMTKEGDYYVFSSTEITEANVIITDNNGWQDPAKDIDMKGSGTMEYVYKSGKLTTITLKSESSTSDKDDTKPTATPKVSATATPKVTATATPKATAKPTTQPSDSKPQTTQAPNNVSSITLKNFTIGKSSPQTVGTAITLVANGDGGSGSYQYKFYVENKATGESDLYSGWRNTGVITWVPKTAGTYSVSAYVKDTNTGAIDSGHKTFKIAKAVKVKTFKCQRCGSKSVKFMLKAVASGKMKYQVTAVKEKGKKFIIHKYSTASTFKYKFAQKGKYTIYLTAKDTSTGVTKTVYKKITVK